MQRSSLLLREGRVGPAACREGSLSCPGGDEHCPRQFATTSHKLATRRESARDRGGRQDPDCGVCKVGREMESVRSQKGVVWAYLHGDGV